jgi:hypothetical protein
MSCRKGRARGTTIIAGIFLFILEKDESGMIVFLGHGWGEELCGDFHQLPTGKQALVQSGSLLRACACIFGRHESSG